MTAPLANLSRSAAKIFEAGKRQCPSNIFGARDLQERYTTSRLNGTPWEQQLEAHIGSLVVAHQTLSLVTSRSMPTRDPVKGDPNSLKHVHLSRPHCPT